MDTWGSHFPGTGDSPWNGPQVGACLARSRSKGLVWPEHTRAQARQVGDGDQSGDREPDPVHPDLESRDARARRASELAP